MSPAEAVTCHRRAEEFAIRRAGPAGQRPSDERIALLGAHLIGVTFSRYVIGVGPLARSLRGILQEAPA